MLRSWCSLVLACGAVAGCRSPSSEQCAPGAPGCPPPSTTGSALPAVSAPGALGSATPGASAAAAVEGTPCPQEPSPRCASDGRGLLGCRDGRLVLLHHCRGPEGCQLRAGVVVCDMSVARLDEPCTLEMSGNLACSADGSQVLMCKGQRFAIEEVCGAGRRCSATPEGTSCAELR